MARSLRKALLVMGLWAAGVPPAVAQTHARPHDERSQDAVVTSDVTRLTLDRRGRVVEQVRQEVEVLTPVGRERYGTLVIGYDSFRRVRRLEGAVRNGSGAEVRRLRRRDIEDHPASAAYSLYDDYRVRVASLHHDTYPYTVVWEYEVEHDELLNWPTWHPQLGEDPVRLAVLRVEAPAGTPLRWLGERMDLEPTVSEAGGVRTLEWSGAFPIRRHEPHGPAWIHQAPRLHLATQTFSIAGTSGSMASWEALAAWYAGLSAGRDALPPAASAEVAALVADTDDPRERARRVYRLLQQRTRYVSVQLGLGGWQPFPATYVHDRRYGDCKALVNYGQALLAAAGVPSYPALIGNGLPDLDPAFPRNAFNHVILYVPLPDGEVWLESTSQTAPFGSIGAGNEDRWALVVTPGGGRLLRTPLLPAKSSPQFRTAHAELATDGSLRVSETVQLGGNQLHEVRGALSQRNASDREGWWRDRVGLAADRFEVDFSALDEEGRVSASYTVPRYAAAVGRRILVHPNVAERWTRVPPASPNRTQPVELSYPFHDTDMVRITLPEGLRVEALPDPVMVETPFARYEALVEVEDGVLVYTREVEIHQRTLPAEAYDAYRQFVEAVVRADDVRVMLARHGGG
jgi:hypothetical protein